MGSVPDLKNAILGSQMIPKSSKTQPFSSGATQMRPREPRRRVGLHILQRIAHFPPGPWLTHCTPQPRPPAPERLLLQTIFYLFLSTSYLLPCAFLLTRTPPPSSLGVGGFERAAPSAADPEKKETSHSNSNFNQVNIKIPSFSTHRFQI